MIVVINDIEKEYPENTSLQDVIVQEIQEKKGFAIALNTSFIPKERYSETHLKEYDRIDIVFPMQGG